MPDPNDPNVHDDDEAPALAAVALPQSKFKAGDVVHLKSGGHHMTVECVMGGLSRPRAKCWWHDNHGVPHTGEFGEATLVLSQMMPENQAQTINPQGETAESWRMKHGLRP